LLACRGDEITLADLPPDIRELGLPSLGLTPVPGPLDARASGDSDILPLRELERRAIQRALRFTQGSVGKAAKLLGIGRATLYRRIATLDLSRDVA
jgi:transcriptional regulator of acetoin/glycerol metabolism